MSVYEIHAIRYAHNGERRRGENFVGGDPHDGPMPMDYFVWVLRGEAGTFVFDTGFDEPMARKRQRRITRPVAEGLKAIGVEPDEVRDVILSHMHYDHAGNHDLFPRARYHIQEEEMRYCTGRCMCHATLRHPFEAADVTAMVGRIFEGRAQFHAGAAELAPGLSVHLVGGHSRGLQFVRARTRRGWVVLASDASHYYENFEQRRPFPILDSLSDMLDGYDAMDRLAASPAHIVPGHDPLVLQRYPASREGLEGVARLDAEPQP
ncbi:N-acyl homoserine lactonase family protein [Roseomonas sp. NAR14]|uniref:N-acyl homoserine lactonase family protein n=1 Tax=Roseomonas acroporae TaxID=2937791 RepID=A0A9X1YCW5_9PROT|nr:N-acyl homoserine lactonase family protein [Roseomonas acroporae]MCK8787833.1 N-acyl homoserine lactonase family protein [Roseomonas acroporae]